MKRKQRRETVQRGDRNEAVRVHNGKGYVKVRVANERGRGKYWSEFVKTRKPCARRKGKGKKKKG